MYENIAFLFVCFLFFFPFSFTERFFSDSLQKLFCCLSFHFSFPNPTPSPWCSSEIRVCWQIQWTFSPLILEVNRYLRPGRIFSFRKRNMRQARYAPWHSLFICKERAAAWAASATAANSEKSCCSQDSGLFCRCFLRRWELCCPAAHRLLGLLLSLPYTPSQVLPHSAGAHPVADGVTTPAQRFISRSDLGRDGGSCCFQLPPCINDFLLSHRKKKKRHLTPAGLVQSCYLL